MMKHSSSKPFIFKCWTFHNYGTDLDCLPAKYIWASILRSGYNFDIFRPEDQHVCFSCVSCLSMPPLCVFGGHEPMAGEVLIGSRATSLITTLDSLGNGCVVSIFDTPLSYLQNASWKSS